MNGIDKLSDAELEKIAGGSDVSSMSDEELSRIAQQPTQQTKQSMGDLLTDMGIAGTGLAALGGAGYGVYKGAEAQIKPWMKYKEAKSELGEFQQRVGQSFPESEITARPVTDIPSVLGAEREAIETTGKAGISAFKTEQQLKEEALANQIAQQKRMQADIELQRKINAASYENTKLGVKNSVDSFKNQLAEFDKNVLGKSIGDLAKDVKMGYPEFFKGGSQYFGQGRQAIENHFSQLGGNIDSGEFSTMLEDVMKDLAKGGAGEEQISRLQDVHNVLNPMEADGVTYKPTRPMSVNEASGHISNITSDSPFDVVSSKVRGKWLDFLESKSTGELKNEVSTLNSWYRRFKQLQEQLISVGGKGGEFNRKGLSNMMIKYTKDRRNDGILDIMKFITEGTDGIKPMENVGKGFEDFLGAIGKSDVIKQQIKSLEKTGVDISEQASKAKIGALKAKEPILKNIDMLSKDLADLAQKGIKEGTIKAEDLEKKLQGIRDMHLEYEKLAGKMAAAGEKIPIKMPGASGVLTALKAGGKLMQGRLIAATPSLLSMVGLGAIDPTQKVLQATGYGQEEQQRAKIAWDKFQAGQGVSEDDKDILISYGLLL